MAQQNKDPACPQEATEPRQAGTGLDWAGSASHCVPFAQLPCKPKYLRCFCTKCASKLVQRVLAGSQSILGNQCLTGELKSMGDFGPEQSSWHSALSRPTCFLPLQQPQGPPLPLPSAAKETSSLGPASGCWSPGHFLVELWALPLPLSGGQASLCCLCAPRLCPLRVFLERESAAIPSPPTTNKDNTGTCQAVQLFDWGCPGCGLLE